MINRICFNTSSRTLISSGGGGGRESDAFFCLQVDGPINRGGANWRQFTVLKKNYRRSMMAIFLFYFFLT